MDRASWRETIMSLYRYAIVASVLVLAAAPARAQTPALERFSLSLGVFVTDRSSDVQLDGQIPGSGTPVDLEKDLGLDASTSAFRIDGYLRFNERHRIDFSAFDLSRSASKRIQTEIEWDGTTYPVDVVVATNFDLTIYKLAYTWSFLRKDRNYLGLTAGLYIADVGTRLEAESIGASSDNGITAPLPVIGLRGRYDFTPRWSFRASAEVFAIDYGDYSGSLYDVYAGLDYRIAEHWGIGVGYNASKINATVANDQFKGDLDWQYGGGLLFVKLDF
jgi:hypothetical protein